MSWHYAARKRKDEFGDDLYELVEVYSLGVTEDAVTVAGESREDLAAWLRAAADDVMRHEVIDESDEKVNPRFTNSANFTTS